jgi:Tfp pilus assembly protein PilN
MSDINLLPEDLREREQDLRAAGGSQDKLHYSKPGAPGETAAPGGVPAATPRWQQLVSALKHNMERPDNGQSSVSSPTLTPQKAVLPPLPPKVEPRPAAPKVDLPQIPPRPPKLPPSGGATPPGRTLEVNLIPLGERAAYPVRKFGLTLVALISSVIVVAGSYVALRASVNKKVSAQESLAAEVTQLQQKLEITRLQTETALALRDRLVTASKLLDERTSWARLFTMLEANTVPSVSFTSLAADQNGKLTLSGLAPNYTEVARQLKAFETTKEVQTVELAGLKRENLTTTDTAISFAMTLNVSPDIFKAVAAP